MCTNNVGLNTFTIIILKHYVIHFREILQRRHEVRESYSTFFYSNEPFQNFINFSLLTSLNALNDMRGLHLSTWQITYVKILKRNHYREQFMGWEHNKNRWQGFVHAKIKSHATYSQSTNNHFFFIYI